MRSERKPALFGLWDEETLLAVFEAHGKLQAMQRGLDIWRLRADEFGDSFSVRPHRGPVRVAAYLDGYFQQAAALRSLRKKPFSVQPATSP